MFDPQIFKDAMYGGLFQILDTLIVFVAPAFVIAVFAFIFRDHISFHFDLHWRKRERLFWQSLFIMLLSGTAVTVYLIKHEHIFILSLLVSFMLIYILNWIGFIDMIIDKIERK